MDREFTRYEKNQAVRRTLVRNLVDLSLLFFTSSRTTLNLYGDLKKTSGEEFTSDNIKNLVLELNHLPGFKRIHFALNNWACSDDLRSWTLLRKSKRYPEPRQAERILVIGEEKKEKKKDED